MTETHLYIYRCLYLSLCMFIIFFPLKANGFILYERIQEPFKLIGCCSLAFHHMQTLNLDSNTVNLGLECAP